MTNNIPQEWTVILDRQPAKIIGRLPRDLPRRIDDVLTKLATDPRPAGGIKLRGYENLYRVRVGDWRIIYAIEADRLIILIIEIAPRGDAYRNL